MISYKKYIILSFIIAALLVVAFLLIPPTNRGIKALSECSRPPLISPDYSESVIPPNIAPLNFTIKEKGNKYYVRIYSRHGDTIAICSKDQRIMIPLRKWEKLLRQNRGQNLYFDVLAREAKGKWKKFRTISNKIAEEEIDGYLVYRLINPGYILWDKLGIYCRNIQNFEEKVILVNDVADGDCMNCHSFCNNNSDNMMFHIRGDLDGTIIWQDGKIKKVNIASEYTMSPGTYPSWHPGGKLIAFSVNRIVQQFHATGSEKIEVYDRASDIILYDTEANMITTSPRVSKKQRESMPAWSPDGKYLYFCVAPEFNTSLLYDSVKYDLMRISYDIQNNEWGEPDTVLTAHATGMSISWPRISPDGRYLLFCMSDHGYFSIHYPGSDLYLLDIETGKYNRPDNLNSDNVESYHSWSRNGRWIVFASKRMNGLCSRPYFSYFDDNGKTHKPFVLPQKDPGFYDTYLRNYNIPEMVSTPVTINKWDLIKKVNGKALNAEFDKNVDIDALSGATRINM